MTNILITVAYMPGIGGIETSAINLMRELAKHSELNISLCVVGNYILRKELIPQNIKIVKGSRVYEYAIMDWNRDKGNHHVYEYPLILLTKTFRRLFGYRFISWLMLHTMHRLGSYDIAISYANNIYFKSDYMGGCEEVVLEKVDAIRKFAWIHNDPRKMNINKINSEERYSRFDRVICVSKACADILCNEIPSLSSRVSTVYNLCDCSSVLSKAKEQVCDTFESKKWTFVTVSRIENKQKRIDKLVETVSKLVQNNYTDFLWIVVGTGPDFNTVSENVRELGLDKYIIMVGYKKNPYPYIKMADALVMTSDYEAYSMVLIEALTIGTPIVSTEYPGVNEIIKNGENGFISKRSAADLADFLKLIMDRSVDLQIIEEKIKHINPNNEAKSQLMEIIK